MRKRRKHSRLMPFWAGLTAGYLTTLGICTAGALIFWLVGADSGIAWLAALPAAALGSFVCGRTAGRQRRHSGLKTGAVCGVMYSLPLMLLGLIFGAAHGVMLPVKLALCIGFGTAGGVAGVNSQDRE